MEIKVDISEALKKFNKSEQALKAGAEQGMEYALLGVERFVQERIRSSGTYGSAKRFAGAYVPFAGPGISAGREDTGLMVNSIVSSTEISGNSVYGTIGWPQNRPLYFDLQEDGFDYEQNKYPISSASHRVEGMFAWRDGLTLMKKTAPGLVQSWAKAFVRRIK